MLFGSRRGNRKRVETGGGEGERARFLKLGRLGIWLEGEDVRVADWGAGEIAITRREARELGEVLRRLGDA